MKIMKKQWKLGLGTKRETEKDFYLRTEVAEHWKERGLPDIAQEWGRKRAEMLRSRVRVGSGQSIGRPSYPKLYIYISITKGFV